MENFLLSANAVVPMFLLMAAGYAAREAGILDREDVFRFNRVAFRVFLPCLLFINIYQSDLHAVANPRLILFAVAGVLLVFLVAFVGAKYLEPTENRRGVVAQGIFRSNFVIMGLPVAEALAGGEYLGSVTLLIAVVVPLFNFLAVFVLEFFRGGKVKPGEVLVEILKNPLVVSSLLGILFQALPFRLPALAETAISNLGRIATPLQLFLLGAFFRFDGIKERLLPTAVVTAIKLFVTPGLLLSAAGMLGVRGVEFIALIGVFATPTAVNSFTMVQQMHCGDEELAGNIVVATSAVSMLSLFLWILLFRNLGMF
ncbi:MAG: AEC family transporter [Candidatus Limivicinus sp.]